MKPSEEQEFTAFVRESGNRLLQYARLLVADPTEAEDVLQVALLRLTNHWAQGLGSPDAYVRTTILNLVRDGVRRRHLVPVPSEAGHDAVAGPDWAEAVVAQSRLEHLLSGLPQRQRITVVLRIVEGLSELETAAAMGCSPGTVKSNLARGLDKVRAVLQPALISKEGTLR